MATALNRTTKQLKLSASPNEHPLVDWIYEPDLSSVTGILSKYWVIIGDVITEMDQTAKNAVDAAELQAIEDGELAEADTGFLRRLVLLIIDELNILRGEHGLSNRTVAQFKTAMRAK